MPTIGQRPVASMMMTAMMRTQKTDMSK